MLIMKAIRHLCLIDFTSDRDKCYYLSMFLALYVSRWLPKQRWIN